jgi:hypothetical protein
MTILKSWLLQPSGDSDMSRRFAFLFCSSLLGLLVATDAGQSPTAAEAKPPLSHSVKQLVEQLGDANQRKADIAEAALLKFGPDILPLLRPLAAKATGDQRKRLEPVIATLNDVAPRTVTLQKKTITLRAALTEVKKQTGIEVVDLRREKTDPELSLDLAGATFWRALDTIAAQAKVVVSVYEGDGQVTLVDGVYRGYPVSYSGIFRTTLKRITVTHDFDSGNRFCTVVLETAWEPRFQPLYLDQGSGTVSFMNDGKRESVLQPGKGSTSVHGRTSLEFSLRLPAPERSVAKLDMIQGDLGVITPSKMLTFTFDKLSRIEKAKEVQTQTQDGVTARLFKLLPDEDRWRVQLLLTYPRVGPRFESYQSWLVNNEISLEKKRGTSRERPVRGGVRINRGTYPRADILYYFSNKNGRLKKPGDWKLVYRAPGRIVTVPLRYEFKDIPMP